MPRSAASDSFSVSRGVVQKGGPRFQILPGFLPSAEADALFDWLLAEVGWRTEKIRMFGRVRTVPRLVAWFGDAGLSYRYSGLEHRADGWPEPLTSLRERIAHLLEHTPNFALLNLYRDGADSLGWHTDAEPMACDHLASLSLGATRRFLLRAGPSEPSIRLDPEHGTLLIFDRHLPHCLPKTRRATGKRVNVSFRTLP